MNGSNPVNMEVTEVYRDVTPTIIKPFLDCLLLFIVATGILMAAMAGQ